MFLFYKCVNSPKMAELSLSVFKKIKLTIAERTGIMNGKKPERLESWLIMKMDSDNYILHVRQHFLCRI
jgi:hypothetical protein